jgi:hypothetical protein
MRVIVAAQILFITRAKGKKATPVPKGKVLLQEMF